MNLFKKFISLFFKYPVLSAGFLIFISLLGIFAPIIAPYDPYIADTRARLQPPGVISGKYNLQNYDLIKSEDQRPRWEQLLDLENSNKEKKIIPKNSKGTIEFQLGPNSSFVDVNRNGDYLDEIVFDDFSNCLGLSQNECPKPNLKYTKIPFYG